MNYTGNQLGYEIRGNFLSYIIKKDRNKSTQKCMCVFPPLFFFVKEVTKYISGFLVLPLTLS